MQDIRNQLNIKSIRWENEGRTHKRIGHVMRMDDKRLTKVACLGLAKISANPTEMSGKKDKTLLYWRKLIREAGMDVNEMDKLTQDRKGWRRAVEARMEHLHKWEKSNAKKQNGETTERNSYTPPSNIEHVWEMWEGFQKPGRPENPYQKDAQRGEGDFCMQQMRSHHQIWKLWKTPQEDMRGRQVQWRWNQDMWQMWQNPTGPKHSPPQKTELQGKPGTRTRSNRPTPSTRRLQIEMDCMSEM